MVSVWIGAHLNRFVIQHNSGTMPVWVINDDMAASLIGDERHSPLTSQSNYVFLSDIFVVPEFQDTGIEYSMVVSIGDLFLWLGRLMIGFSQILLIFVIPIQLIRWFDKKLIKLIDKILDSRTASK
jgi:hypothetical protein